MSRLGDTIFARASGAGQAAIAILRISGPRTSAVVQALAGQLPLPRMASLRRLRQPERGEVLDEAVLLWFPRPRSYTGEDLAEMHLHGGSAVVAGVVDALVGLGCRPAEPGELTRRAFLNGRMDLTQAEGIADLIAAETASQRSQALRQVRGALTELYEGWRTRLVRILAQQEAAIEFETDDLPSDLGTRAGAAAAALRDEILCRLDDGGRGERLRSGLSIAILGAPNAGKSSLLNALVGRPAAIVSPRAGTTRDVIECRMELAGVPAVIADTAGLRESADEVEQEGMRRAIGQARKADLVIAAFAADLAPDTETLTAITALPEVVVAGTKADLATPPQDVGGHVVLPTSAVTGDGLVGLRQELERRAARLANVGETPTLTRARHRAALAETATHLGTATDAALPEIAAEGYRQALAALGRLTGHVTVEQVLDAVFRDFCIGK